MVNAVAHPRKMEIAKSLFARIRPYLTFANLSLAFMLVCCLLIGVFEAYETYISFAMLAVILLNWKNDEFYVFSVIFILYWEQFYLIAGSTPLFRVYTYLLMIRFVFDLGKVRFRPQFMPPLAVMACFCVLAAGRMALRTGLNLLVDMLVAFFLVTRFRQNPKLMRKMMLVFTLTAVCAGIYSLIAESLVSYETGLGAQVEIVRYYGTVGDANAAGCFYDVAIFMALCADSMKKWYIRVPIVIALVYFLLLTASQTGLLCCAIGFCLFFLLRYRLAGVLPVFVFGVGTVLFVYALIYIPAIQSIGFLKTVSNRLIESFVDAETGNMVSLTTNRVTLWNIAIEYFKDQTALKKILGGNVVATIISEEYFLKAVGAIHQSYIQGLLDFGIIGVVIVFGTRIWQTFSDALCCFRGKNGPLPLDLLRGCVLCSYTFLLYAFTIDMFMDWRFLFLYFS